MAVRAGHGEMPASQHEMSFLVLGEGKRRRLVCLEAVAAVAGVEVRRGGKPSGVAIAVTIGAAVEFHFEQSVFALCNVALRALQARMPTLQRVSGRGVLLHREEGWLPTLHVVTGGALAAVRALCKLSVVGILVAIHTFLEGERLLEISALMSLRATYCGVLAEEGELGFRVVEALAYGFQVDLLPSAGVVA